ncbi:MAG TPA: MerR family DNA-binding transcriptional regulator [Pseudohongiella sp.]|nr:MerR family DNA-binding transcriptional regulator [Pseudohongiella sp.]
MNISEAAQRSGLSAKMIRYYEDIGLITPPARSDSGYRLYNSRNVEQRMARLQAMKSLLADMISQCAGNDDPHCVILNKLASDETEILKHD